MAKNNKKQISSKKEYERKQEKKITFMSVFILIIMCLSVVGFAVISGGGRSNSDNGLPSEIPFQQFQDPNTGTIFWGAVRNSEQFVFESIDGYEEEVGLSEIANNIKSKNSVSVYVDGSFNSPESVYLIEKALKGLKIDYVETVDDSCAVNKLVLTGNRSFSGDCLVFESLENTYDKTEILVYHLVK